MLHRMNIILRIGPVKRVLPATLRILHVPTRQQSEDHWDKMAEMEKVYKNRKHLSERGQVDQNKAFAAMARGRRIRNGLFVGCFSMLVGVSFGVQCCIDELWAQTEEELVLCNLTVTDNISTKL